MEVKPGFQKSEEGHLPHGWSVKKFSDFCLLQRGFDLTETTRIPGDVPVYSSSGISYYHNVAKENPPGVVTGRKGQLGEVYFIEEPYWPHDTTLWVRNFRKNDPKFVYWYLKSFHLERFDAATSVPTLNRNNLSGIEISIPQPLEQRVIATALSDADAHISSLEQVIAKKRDLKQAAMQELLTGKRRLPGFSGQWKIKRLGDVSAIKTGKKNNEDKKVDGLYPFFVRSQTVERINSYSFDGEAILIPGEGGIGAIIHYINGKFDYHQRVYKISDFILDTCGKYVYFNMLQSFNKQAMRNTVKATVDSLRLPTFLEFEFLSPPLKEQRAIATVLSDMDAELAALEQQRDKTKAIKQGMMQELLTGRIRLV